MPLGPTTASFSPRVALKTRSLRTGLSKVLLSLSTLSASLPLWTLGSKRMKGRAMFERLRSTRSILAIARRRDWAWLAFLALAPKRWMNSLSSEIFLCLLAMPFSADIRNLIYCFIISS